MRIIIIYWNDWNLIWKQYSINKKRVFAPKEINILWKDLKQKLINKECIIIKQVLRLYFVFFNSSSYYDHLATTLLRSE